MSYKKLPYIEAILLREEMNFVPEDCIDLKKVIDNLNIIYSERELSNKTAGVSKVVGIHKYIFLNISNPLIEYMPYKRFTIAHEIGHVILHRNTKMNICGEDVFKGNTKNQREYEANEFASELLLPRKIVQEELKYKDISIELAQQIADKYKLSLTATLISMIKQTDCKVMLFCHNGERLKWVIKSSECYMKAETCIVGSNVTHMAKENVTSIKDYVDSDLWINSSKIDRCLEETLFNEQLGTYLTIINIEED